MPYENNTLDYKINLHDFIIEIYINKIQKYLWKTKNEFKLFDLHKKKISKTIKLQHGNYNLIYNAFTFPKNFCYDNFFKISLNALFQKFSIPNHRNLFSIIKWSSHY